MSEVELPKKKSWLFKDVPEDVFNYCLNKQTDMKIKKGIAQYSLPKIIYQLLREHKSLTEK